MKIIVKNSIACKDIRKHLPPQYNGIIPSDLKKSEETINIVCFPGDSGKVITSKYIKQAYSRIGDDSLQTIFFGYCFTKESQDAIKANNDIFFHIHDFDWTDESWVYIHQW